MIVTFLSLYNLLPPLFPTLSSLSPHRTTSILLPIPTSTLFQYPKVTTWKLLLFFETPVLVPLPLSLSSLQLVTPLLESMIRKPLNLN